VRFLAAIEEQEFEKLPGGVFAKAFVRQYGRLLGLNEEELAAQVQQVLEPPAAEVSEPSRPVRTGLAPIQVPRMEEWQAVGDRRRWSGSLSAAIVVVVVMLVCSGVYAWLQRPHNPISAHNNPPPLTTPAAPVQAAPEPSAPAQTAAAPSAAPTEQPPPSGTPASQPQTPPVSTAPSLVPSPVAPAPATTAVKPERASAAPNPDATIHVAITAEEPVWVLARADGKYAFSGTLEAQQTRTVDAVTSVLIRLGNAGGVNITLNGKPIGPVGPKGQVRTVQFTPGGFQIVPAKPPSDGPAAPIARL